MAFTPDEEVGRGTEHFDVKRFGATFAYTIDGSGVGELESETFCADTAFLTVTGADVHPGYAKGKMINALRVVSDLVMALPQHRTPETTEGAGGLPPPDQPSAGNVSEAKAQFLVRDFSEDGLSDLEGTLRAAVAWVEHRYVGAKALVEVKQLHPYVQDARISTRRSPTTRRRRSAAPASTRKRTSVRGGTDGSRLTFMGVSTPNLFDGSMNFHGKQCTSRSSGWSRWSRQCCTVWTCGSRRVGADDVSRGGRCQSGLTMTAGMDHRVTWILD